MAIKVNLINLGGIGRWNIVHSSSPPSPKSFPAFNNKKKCSWFWLRASILRVKNSTKHSKAKMRPGRVTSMSCQKLFNGKGMMQKEKLTTILHCHIKFSSTHTTQCAKCFCICTPSILGWCLSKTQDRERETQPKLTPSDLMQEHLGVLLQRLPWEEQTSPWWKSCLKRQARYFTGEQASPRRNFKTTETRWARFRKMMIIGKLLNLATRP